MLGGQTQYENLHCSSQEENHQETDPAHSDWVGVSVEAKTTASYIPALVGVRTKVFMTCKVNLSFPNPATSPLTAVKIYSDVLVKVFFWG